VIFEAQTLWAARVIHHSHTSDCELAVEKVFLTFFLVWLLWFPSQREGGIQTDDGLSNASISLHFHCPCTALQMSTVWVKLTKKNIKLRFCFSSLYWLQFLFPLLHPMISISNQLNSLHGCLKMLEECHSGFSLILWGPVCVYGISACAYVYSATLLLCKTGISAPPPPRRNTSKGNQTTGPLCGPDPASYQNRARCLHSAIVYGGRGFVWYVTHACSSLFTFWRSNGRRQTLHPSSWLL